MRKAGSMEVSEHKMLQNVFHLDDRPVTSLIVSRADVHSLDGEMTISHAFRLCAEWCEMGSFLGIRQPGLLNELLGFIHVCEMLAVDSDLQEFF